MPLAPVALALLFFAAGVRTPLLALLAFRRVRNIALIAAPYGAGLLVVAALGPSLAEADRLGLVAVAIAPALLAAPALAGAIGGRMDRTGSLVVGSIAAWLVLSLTRGGAAAGVAQTTMLPFLIGAGVTSAVPMLPAVLRTAAQRLGDVAFLILAAIAVSSAGALDPANGLAALALFVAVAGSAAVVAGIGGVDLGSALAGAGSRDPAVATGLALALGGAAAIPLYSAILLLALSAGLALRNRRKSR